MLGYFDPNILKVRHPSWLDRFRPYYMLHGKEIVLLTTQHIRAKLSPKVRGTDYEDKLENLSLNSA